MQEAALKALSKPEIREKIANQGMDATPSKSPEEFAAENKVEGPMWEKVVRDSGAIAKQRQWFVVRVEPR